MNGTKASKASWISGGLVVVGLWLVPGLVKSPALGGTAMARSHSPIAPSLERVHPAVEPAAFNPSLGQPADYLPQPSTPSVTHLVLELSERTLYVYDNQTELRQFSVAVGRTNWETPTGQFTIFQMLKDPAWENPLTGQVVPPGANNPLGQRWIGFWSDGNNAIGFHGTPNEESIGQAVSHGCVRLRNQDAIALYDMVSIGTPVYVTP